MIATREAYNKFIFFCIPFIFIFLIISRQAVFHVYKINLTFQDQN